MLSVGLLLLAAASCKKERALIPDDKAYFEDIARRHAEMEKVSERWKREHNLADFMVLKDSIGRGTRPVWVTKVLGEPLRVTKLADGGESWLYVKADPQRGQNESWTVVFDAEQEATGVFSKPIE